MRLEWENAHSVLQTVKPRLSSQPIGAGRSSNPSVYERAREHNADIPATVQQRAMRAMSTDYCLTDSVMK
jgi:hypothetical protein